MIKLQSVNREARWQSSLLCGLLRKLYWDAVGGGRSTRKTCSDRSKILLNNCLSDVEHRVAKSSSSLSQKPDRLLLFRNACSFCRSATALPRYSSNDHLRTRQVRFLCCNMSKFISGFLFVMASCSSQQSIFRRVWHKRLQLISTAVKRILSCLLFKLILI